MSDKLDERPTVLIVDDIEDNRTLLRNFLTERGRIVPRRISGNCLGHQRDLTMAIKRARTIAMLSFAEER